MRARSRRSRSSSAGSKSKGSERGTGRGRRRSTRTPGSRPRRQAARSTSRRHVALAVPFRAAERNRRVAASVLAGGIAYRLFLWLLPFGLIVGGALGLMNADSTEKAVAAGGLPGAIATRRRRVAFRALQLVVAPRGRRAPPPLGGIHGREGGAARSRARLGRASSARPSRCRGHLPSPACCSRSWPQSHSPGGSATTGRASSLRVITVAPLAALWLWVSLQLPHRDAPWQALLPGALLVAIGFQVLHELVV